MSFRFGSQKPVSFSENRDALMHALDRAGWPGVTERDIVLLEGEIRMAQENIERAYALQKAARNEVRANDDGDDDDDDDDDGRESNRTPRSGIERDNQNDRQDQSDGEGNSTEGSQEPEDIK